MEVIGLDRSGDLRQVQGAVRLHLQGLGLDRTEHRRAAAFVFVGVGLLADDVLIATLAVSHQPQQVAHGASGHEQPRREPQAPGEFGFETIDSRVLAIHIVAGRRAGHGIQHGGGRLGDRVAAKIDNAHESGLGCGWGEFPFEG